MSNANDHDRDRDHAHDHDQDRNRDHANDNGEHKGSGSKQVAPGPVGSKALTSLAALQTAFAKVNTAIFTGRTGLPMLLFKSREGSGTWGFGQKRTIPEEGSRWAINPTTFRYGYICFDGKRKVDERLVPVTQPKPDITQLPDTGFKWQEEWAVEMKCLDGADAGVEVDFKANTDGTLQAIAALFDLVRERINEELAKPEHERDGKIAPIVVLEKDSYPHREFGKIYIPVLNVVDWMPLSGPAPTPTPVEPTPGPKSGPASAAAEQPRRRRVA